jgi:hypothetical protein
MRLSRKLGGLLGAGMMALGITTAAAPAKAAAAPYWAIVTMGGLSGAPYECLQDDAGRAVTQHFCDPTFTNTHQLWLPISTGGNGYKFENLATGLCLWAFEVGPPHNGVPVTLSDCTVNDTNSRWAWIPFPGGVIFPGIEPIQSRVSGSTGYCLDVPGASTAIGLQMQLYQCNGTDAQEFWIVH